MLLKNEIFFNESEGVSILV